MASECHFEWHHLNVFVGEKEKRKQILFDFNGEMTSGELLAVMGGSGAGKSTLLNVLSGRTNLNEQSVEGSLANNAHQFPVKNQDIIRSLCTYVPQSDILCATQTVEEALLFYAKLKLPTLSPELQEKRVKYLIEILKLEKCRDSFIGDESKRGISGGEKRRVSIAAEILNDADIIFLDEPTSGLDAYTAARTIKTLKQFCFVSNKIIIATIHQPSYEVFYLFDRLLLLSDGRCCYNAPIRQIDEFFTSALRPKTNPADVIIFEVQRNPREWADEWANTSINAFRKAKSEWDEYPTFDVSQLPKRKRSLCLEYKLLFIRESRGIIREPRVSLIRIAQILFFAIGCGSLYWEIDETFVARGTCHFLINTIALLYGMVALLTVFPKQKLLFEREYSSKAYSIVTWAVVQTLLEIPRRMFSMIVFTAIVLSMTQFEGDFGEYLFTLFLSTIAGGSFGYLFGSMTKTAVEAVQTVPIAFIPLLIFSDTFIELDDFGDDDSFAVKLAALDPLYWMTRAMYIIEFVGVTYAVTECSVEKWIPATRFFAMKVTPPIDVDDLSLYWLYTLIICVVIRVLSVLILMVINMDGFSWLKQ